MNSGVTVPNSGGLGFGVARAKDHARIFLNNNTGAPLRVVFASGQTFDMTLDDAEDRRTHHRRPAIYFDDPTTNRIVISSLVPTAPSAAFGGLIPNAVMGNRVSPS